MTNTPNSPKSLVLQELEILEKFLLETPESGIIESANYIFERVKLNIEKIKGTNEEFLASRFAEVLNRVEKIKISYVNDCKIKIAVCYYQPWELPQNDLFLPIQAGKAISKFDLKMLGDDTGDNISDKNATFSEFTAWYWTWKNIKTMYPNLEYIGLSHYRRYFHLEVPYTQYPVFYTPKIPEMKNYDRLFVEKLSSCDIILSKPAYFSCDVKTQYSAWHKRSDYLCMQDVVSDICPEYLNSFKSVFDNNNGISLYCMFVARYELFDNYFSWLFPILFEADKRIYVSGYDAYNKRALAFLAERLLNVYVLHHKLKVDYEPIYFIEPLNNDIDMVTNTPPTPPQKSLVLKELEILEKFLLETLESGIIESANYIFERVKLNIEKIRGTKEEFLASRFAAVLNRVEKYISIGDDKTNEFSSTDFFLDSEKIKNLTSYDDDIDKETQNPSVSIVVVTYNHVKYIRSCLNGILMQKTDFPFEVLIHDDASTDGTQDIIMEYQQKFPKIIKPVYEKENQFSKDVYIIDFIFNRVKGKYVALCEGDDYWTDEYKLQIQADFMESHPECSVCFHPVTVIHEDGLKPNSIYPTQAGRFNKTVLSLEDLLITNFIQTNSVMYRWTFYGKEYKSFIPKPILPGDWYMHLFHAQFGSICFINKCMAVYYRHADSMWSGNILLKHGIKHIKFFEAVLENIAINKKFYLDSCVIPFMKQVYKVFKENNYSDGLNFIENNSNWKNAAMQKNTSIQDILNREACVKLHLGCGTVYKEGWINIDNNSDNNIQKLDLDWDLRNPLPFPDNSVDFIYNEHFLEHLTVEEGISSIKDFYRVLKPDGVMRIAMPDLEQNVKNYFDENWKENNKENLKKFGLTFIQTRAECININFRWWGHKWLYDWEELERRLKEAGCEKIKRCVIFESEHEEIKNMETRNESNLIAEVTKTIKNTHMDKNAAYATC